MLSSCTNVKKVQVIQDALSTIDSSSLKKVPEIDSLSIVKPSDYAVASPRTKDLLMSEAVGT